jgi:protein-disulfide isomerase
MTRLLLTAQATTGALAAAAPSWWLQPQRLLQTNLREIDARMDVAAYVVARCAGDDKFFAVLDDLFANQEGIVQAAQVGALGNTLKTIAKRHGIETDEAFDACMDNPAIRDELAAVYQSAEQFQVAGTPTFVLDGKVRNFEGDYRSPEGFSRQIDALLAEKGAQ